MPQTTRKVTPKPGFTFPGPVPTEALSYFRAKKLKVGFDFRDVWREEHATAFTVAKAMNLDVLESIRGAADKALAEGMTFAQFKRDLQPMLERLGWWGRKDMTDPLTGKMREVQLGSPRRLKTIYNANMRTARAAGQWERIQRNKKTDPYLLYRLGPSENHREQHLRWNGLLLPIDDPFWTSHFPPNGWGCKCWIRQVSKQEYERLVGTGKYPTKAPKKNTQKWINKRTGEIEKVPRGIDPGWDTNPGMAARQAQALDTATDKLNATTSPLAVAGVRDLISTPGFAAWYKQPEGRFPVAVLPDEHARQMGASSHTVLLSADTATKQRDIHPDIDAADYHRVQETIERGQQIQDTPRTLIYFLEEEQGYVSVIKTTESGKTVFLTSFRRLSRDAAKRDREIKRLLNK